MSNVATVDVAFPDGRSYVISIADGLLDDSTISTGVEASHAVVISELAIVALGPTGPFARTIANLERRGIRVDTITFTGGEDRKTMAWANPLTTDRLPPSRPPIPTPLTA